MRLQRDDVNCEQIQGKKKLLVPDSAGVGTLSGKKGQKWGDFRLSQSGKVFVFRCSTAIRYSCPSL